MMQLAALIVLGRTALGVVEGHADHSGNHVWIEIAERYDTVATGETRNTLDINRCGEQLGDPFFTFL